MSLEASSKSVLVTVGTTSHDILINLCTNKHFIIGLVNLLITISNRNRSNVKVRPLAEGLSIFTVASSQIV